MDIILANEVKEMDFNHTGHHTITSDKTSSIVEDRLGSFVQNSIETFLDSIDDPYQLGSTYVLDHYRSALFPSSGILT